MVDLADVARRLVAPGKGILASDESTGTVGKRLEKVGLSNTEEVRRAYRELLYTAPIGSYVSGAIMFKETLYQSTKSGTPFVEVLGKQGILAGIKVDEGLEPLLGGRPGETWTRGLDRLGETAKAYAAAGASFAKWRTTLKVAHDCPSLHAIESNAHHLAMYAAICQAAGLVPVVEPEILIDGDHTITRFGEVTEQVLGTVVAHLWRAGVSLEGCLMKPQMVIPGNEYAGPKPTPEEVAEHTVKSMRRVLPPAIPGITFLSGGQTEEEATINLNAINKYAAASGGCPWALTFSFGRALQASVLKTWAADTEANVPVAQGLAAALAAANSAAALGQYTGPHPSVMAQAGSLHEGFRGWTSHAT